MNTIKPLQKMPTKKPANKAKNGIQGYTNQEKRFAKIFESDIIPEETINQFSKEERAQFVEFIKVKMDPNITGGDRDRFANKMFFLLDKESRNIVWEQNHNRITWALSCEMQETGRMLSATEIATKLNLSRATVYKHLREFQSEDFYKDHLSQFKMMRSRILSNLYKSATLESNTKAARIFLEATGGMPSFPLQDNATGVLINNQQNNFLQLNGTLINLSELPAEQLTQFENLVKSISKNS